MHHAAAESTRGAGPGRTVPPSAQCFRRLGREASRRTIGQVTTVPEHHVLPLGKTFTRGPGAPCARPPTGRNSDLASHSATPGRA
ncbi:hypothetical protein JOC24_003099 [Streptomyces sp. HB132]|nr:hypothetical protein [Streptomyces sp. HB132]